MAAQSAVRGISRSQPVAAKSFRGMQQPLLGARAQTAIAASPPPATAVSLDTARSQDALSHRAIGGPNPMGQSSRPASSSSRLHETHQAKESAPQVHAALQPDSAESALDAERTHSQGESGHGDDDPPLSEEAFSQRSSATPTRQSSSDSTPRQATAAGTMSTSVAVPPPTLPDMPPGAKLTARVTGANNTLVPVTSAPLPQPTARRILIQHAGTQTAGAFSSMTTALHPSQLPTVLAAINELSTEQRAALVTQAVLQPGFQGTPVFARGACNEAATTSAPIYELHQPIVCSSAEYLG